MKSRMFIIQKSLILLALLLTQNAFSQKVYTSEEQVNFMKEGYTLYQEEKYENARELFLKVSFNDTNYTEAQYFIARSYAFQEKYDDAIKVAEELLKYPISFDLKSQTYVFLGDTYIDAKNYDQALKTVEEGLKFYPKNESLFLVRKQIYIETKKFDLAFEDLKIALLYNVNNVKVHLQNGLFAANQGKFSEAILSLTTCLLIEPTGDRANSILSLLESIANGSFTPENKDFIWPENDNYFEELNLAVSNKVALQSSYKAKFTIPTAYAYQLHLILANSKFDAENTSFWNQNYLNFYKTIFDENKLDDLVLFTLQSTQNEPTLKKLKSKQSRISAFIDYAGKIWNNTKSYKLINDGEKFNKVYVIYNANGIEGFGNYSETKAIGKWEYFNEFGGALAEGQFNDEGLKTGIWKWYHPHYGTLKEEANFVDGKINGADKYYYETGGLKAIYYIKDEKLVDSIVNYYQSGQLSEVIKIKDGLKSGVAFEYFPNGMLKYKSTYVENEANGLFESFHENGKLSKQFNLKDNKIDGVKKEFYVNGQLASEQNYKEGVLEGPFKEYHYNGQLEGEGVYKKGNWLGEIKFYYSNGNLASKVEFDESGKENGIKYFYDYDGKLYQEFHFKKGELISIYFTDKAGKRSLISEKKDKKILFKDFYPNGVCKSEVLSVDGLYEGEEKEYDIYGNLESLTKYEKGITIDTLFVYHLNGSIKRKIPFLEGERNGVCIEYNILGQKIIEGAYSKGNQDGDWYYYDDKGAITSHKFFVEDQIQGLANYYYRNGHLKLQEVFQDGLVLDNNYFDTLGNPRQNVKLFNGNIQLKNLNNSYVYLNGNYKNGINDGLFKWYYANNKLETNGKYINDERDSVWNWYHPNGKLKESVNYVCGLMNGKNIEYDQNGLKKSEFNYVASNIEGIGKLYENGIIEAELNYFNGSREGKSTYYSLDGQIQQYRYYSKGDLISYSYLNKQNKEVEPITITRDSVRMVSYYANGNLSFDQTRKNGLIHGYTKEFYSNGKIKVNAAYYNGLSHGKSIEYNTSGQVISEKNYYLDELDGKQIEYYGNGKLRKVSNYYLGEKDGFEYEYNESGLLTKTRYYYNNQLVYEK